MDIIEELKQRLAKLEGPAPRQHPALPEAERQRLAAELARLRSDRIGEARAFRAATEKAEAACGAAIRKARTTLSVVENEELSADQNFAAAQAALVRALRHGEPDSLAEFRGRLETEQARAWDAVVRSGMHTVSQDHRLRIDRGLQARRRALSDLGERVETWAEEGDVDAALRQRFESELAKIPTAEKIVAETKAVPPVVIIERPEPDRKAIAERLARVFQDNPRNVTYS